MRVNNIWNAHHVNTKKQSKAYQETDMGGWQPCATAPTGTAASSTRWICLHAGAGAGEEIVKDSYYCMGKHSLFAPIYSSLKQIANMKNTYLLDSLGLLQHFLHPRDPWWHCFLSITRPWSRTAASQTADIWKNSAWTKWLIDHIMKMCKLKAEFNTHKLHEKI